MNDYKDVQLVEKYLAFKAHVAAETEKFDAQIKPYKDGMATIENEFLRRLDERGADNTKTDAGTAYKSTIHNFKVVDRDAFLKFCTTYWDNGGSDMLNVSAVKDPVKEFMNGNAMPPPGIEPSSFIRVNIRRT
jgi:hypothetical protein